MRGQVCISRRRERCADGQDRLASFEVRRQVTIRQDDPEAFEDLLDAIIQAADVEVKYHFEVSDREAIMRRLRLVAIKRARTRAANLMKMTGHVLGDVVHLNVNEDFDGWQERSRSYNGAGDSGPEAKYLSTRVNVGYAVD